MTSTPYVSSPQDAPRPKEDKFLGQSSKETSRSLGAAIKEFYRFNSPRLLTVMALAAVALKVVLGGWSLWDLAIVAAVLAFWPIQEWLIHVFILHMKPIKLFGKAITPTVAKRHQYHHAHPWDLASIFVPVRVELATAPLVVAFWWLVTPTWGLFATGMAVFLIMALVYEWTHYLIHSKWRPQSKFYKHLWQSHRLHHCKNENYWFGVTMTGGDTLFGTNPDQKTVETSDTCRTLGRPES